MSLVIVGAGPNLGGAVARKFAADGGMSVGLVSRSEEKLRALAEELQHEGISVAYAAADIREPASLTAAIETLAGHNGPVEVLEYSPLPAKEFMKPILETRADDLRGPLEFSVIGAATAVDAVLGPMLEAGAGSILFTTGGAAVEPYPERAGVGVSFAAEVVYARLLHEALAPKGVHVGHTAIAGRIAEGGDHEPADVAAALWRHHSERNEFQLRLGFD